MQSEYLTDSLKCSRTLCGCFLSASSVFQSVTFWATFFDYFNLASTKKANFIDWLTDRKVKLGQSKIQCFYWKNVERFHRTNKIANHFFTNIELSGISKNTIRNIYGNDFVCVSSCEWTVWNSKWFSFWFMWCKKSLTNDDSILFSG